MGLPFSGNPTTTIFWEPVVNKVVKRLDSWRRAFLSKGGRLVLIEAVLTANPTYFMSLFKMPNKTAKRIKKLMRDFLWSGNDGCEHDHLVDWKNVCKPKNKGGLGVGNLLKKNKTLCFKWLWSFQQNDLLFGIL